MVSCSHLLFCFSDKNRIGSGYVAGVKAFILANLRHECIVIVENTGVKFLVRVSKYCA